MIGDRPRQRPRLGHAFPVVPFLQDATVAGGEDELQEWKGWVESRLRQLMAKVKRDTAGELLCHQTPHTYDSEPRGLECTLL